MTLTLHKDPEAYLFAWAHSTMDAAICCYLCYPEKKQKPPNKSMERFLKGLSTRTGFTLTNELLDLILLNATHRETAPSLHKKSQALVLALKAFFEQRPKALRQLQATYLAWKKHCDGM